MSFEIEIQNDISISKGWRKSFFSLKYEDMLSYNIFISININIDENQKY